VNGNGFDPAFAGTMKLDFDLIYSHASFMVDSHMTVNLSHLLKAGALY
jgi:hypothetical protein